MNKYQTTMQRFWAGVVDGVILIPLSWVDDLVYGTASSTALIISWMLISYPAYWLYSVLMHGFYGQTLGKMLLRVKVLDVSEAPITMRQAFLRDSIYILINTAALIITIYFILSGRETDAEAIVTANTVLLTAALVWFLAEILTCLTNAKRRAVHDFIAGTVVVKTEPLPAEAGKV